MEEEGKRWIWGRISHLNNHHSDIIGFNTKGQVFKQPTKVTPNFMHQETDSKAAEGLPLTCVNLGPVPKFYVGAIYKKITGRVGQHAPELL